MTDRRRAVVVLKMIAASAEKLASDLDGNRLWEREYGKAVAQIQRAIRDLPSLP